VTWSRAGTSGELSAVLFEQSPDQKTWKQLGFGTRVTGTSTWTLSGLSLPANGLFYIRARGFAPVAGVSSSLYQTIRELNFASPLAIAATSIVASADGAVPTAAAPAYVTEPFSGITPLSTSMTIGGSTVEI